MPGPFGRRLTEFIAAEGRGLMRRPRLARQVFDHLDRIVLSQPRKSSPPRDLQHPATPESAVSGRPTVPQPEGIGQVALRCHFDGDRDEHVRPRADSRWLRSSFGRHHLPLVFARARSPVFGGWRRQSAGANARTFGRVGTQERRPELRSAGGGGPSP